MEFGLLPLAIIEKHKQKNSVRELCPSLRSNLLDDVSHLCASVCECVCVCVRSRDDMYLDSRRDSILSGALPVLSREQI